MNKRFKIDNDGSYNFAFRLYRWQPAWHTRITGCGRWEMMQYGQTREECLKQYELIKDLPQYLD